MKSLSQILLISPELLLYFCTLQPLGYYQGVQKRLVKLSAIFLGWFLFKGFFFGFFVFVLDFWLGFFRQSPTQKLLILFMLISEAHE